MPTVVAPKYSDRDRLPRSFISDDFDTVLGKDIFIPEHQEAVDRPVQLPGLISSLPADPAQPRLPLPQDCALALERADRAINHLLKIDGRWQALLLILDDAPVEQLIDHGHLWCVRESLFKIVFFAAVIPEG